LVNIPPGTCDNKILESTPYLVKKLKATVDIPIQLHAHATTGLSTASIVKAEEAGIDRVDTAIGSMSMTYVMVV
jgi:pyruvate/oxaloacetate carboxyltransferase